MKDLSTIKVIWYDSSRSHYQSGTWKDYSKLKSTSKHPEDFLVLERFSKEPLSRISKIVQELNKVSKHSKITL